MVNYQSINVFELKLLFFLQEASLFFAYTRYKGRFKTEVLNSLGTDPLFGIEKKNQNMTPTRTNFLF